jgi:hypothetical protein
MMKALYHHLYKLYLYSCAFYLRLYFSSVKKSEKPLSQKKIMVLPAYPKDWPGGKERMAYWKPFFEEDGIEYFIHWSCNQYEYLDLLDQEFTFKSFHFHCRKLLSRVKILQHIRKFDAIYIQREAIPLYDSRYVGIEKVIIQNQPNIVFDFYDADYEGTPLVTHFIFQHAPKITVASSYLEDKVGQYNSHVLFTRLSLPNAEKQLHEKRKSGKVKIGWMGSPGNAQNLIKLDPVFSQLAEKYPEVEFHFVCRNPPDLKFKGIKWDDMNNNSFDYPKWLESIDIGIAPYFSDDDRTKAKTAMKSLEFWANGVALVCSPHGMSDKIKHNKNCLIAHSQWDWEESLNAMVRDRATRSRLGENGFDTFNQYHTYSKNFEELKNFLLSK